MTLQAITLTIDEYLKEQEYITNRYNIEYSHQFINKNNQNLITIIVTDKIKIKFQTGQIYFSENLDIKETHRIEVLTIHNNKSIIIKEYDRTLKRPLETTKDGIQFFKLSPRWTFYANQEQKTEDQPKKIIFETGKTYYYNLFCDSQRDIKIKILDRTKNTVTFLDASMNNKKVTKKIRDCKECEFIYPIKTAICRAVNIIN